MFAFLRQILLHSCEYFKKNLLADVVVTAVHVFYTQKTVRRTDGGHGSVTFTDRPVIVLKVPCVCVCVCVFVCSVCVCVCVCVVCVVLVCVCVGGREGVSVKVSVRNVAL